MSASATASRGPAAWFARADTRVLIAILVVAGLLVRLPLIFNDFASSTVPDTGSYLDVTASILDGDGIDSNAYRTLGYPLLAIGPHLLPGPTVNAIVVIQHLLGIAIAVGVLLIGARLFDRRVGFVAGLLVALAAPMMLVEHYAIPDFAFMVVTLIAATTLAITAEPERPASGRLILVGLLFGLAVHIKPNGQLYAAVAPLVLAFSTRSVRETLRGSALVLVTMALVVAPWVIYNGANTGHYTVSIQGGQSLWLRLFDQDKQPIPTDTADGRFTKQVYDDYIARLPPGKADDWTDSYSAVLSALINRGDSLYEGVSIQGRLAREAIKNDPVSYLIGTARNVGHYGALNFYFPRAEREAKIGLIGSTTFPDALTWIGWRIADVLTTALAIVSLGGLAALLLLRSGTPRRSQVAAATFLVTWLVLVVGSSLVNWVEPRFAAQVAPLQWLLQAAGALALWQLVGEWRERRRAQTETAIGAGRSAST